MALADTIILNKNQILLTQIDTTEIGLSGSNLQWGYIQLVSALTDRYVVGNYVLYDPLGQTSIIFDSIEYFLVQEDKIFFSANIGL